MERLARDHPGDVPDQKHAEADQQDEGSSPCVSSVRCGPLPATIAGSGRKTFARAPPSAGDGTVSSTKGLNGARWSPRSMASHSLSGTFA